MLEYLAAALDITSVTPSDKLLLIQLAGRCDRHGQVKATIEELMRACCVTERTVHKSLRQLERHHRLRIERQPGGPSSYTLLLPAVPGQGR